MNTRRRFLRDCSLVVATVSLPASAAWAQPRDRGLAGEGLRFEHFAAQLNTPFIVRTGSVPVKVVLVQARPAPPPSPDAEDAGHERFSLLFQGSPHQPLEQDTYLLEHPRLGRQAIFIAPVGPADAAGCFYEAVFNRAVAEPRIQQRGRRAIS